MSQPSPEQLRVYLGLGANLGDPAATLAAARDTLAALPQGRLSACSSLYRTAPVGGPPGQPDYVNAAVELDTTLPPQELLERCLAIEARFGRQRRERWGPRSLDIDLLLYDALVSDDSRLTLPHPRLHLRRFVLEPLCELAPQLVHPRLLLPLQELLRQLADPNRVERLTTDW